MSYITNNDLEERLGSATLLQLADDDANGVADVGIVDEARLAAEGEVNSRLAVRYAVPIDLTAHPELADLLGSFTLDLAEYRLRLRRPPVSEDARHRRDHAVEWLEGVAAGRMQLPSVSPVATRGIGATAIGAERILTRSEMESL